MCLGIPVKVIKKSGNMGIGETGGVRREIDLRFIKNIKIGDYVILHAGFAIQKLDKEEAKETLSLFNEMLELEKNA